MKQASLILNIVLLLAVGYLMIAHFRAPKAATAGPAASTGQETVAAAADSKIVFVNADTLLEKYEGFKKRKDALSKKEKDADASLKARGRALEKEFMEAQQKVQQGFMTPKEVQQLEQTLSQKQQKLMADQERMTKALVDETTKIQEELQKEVKDILSALRKEKGYDYILNYAPGSGVLMVNDTLDITAEVLSRLNQKKPDDKQ
jgi:outer membrane protein